MSEMAAHPLGPECGVRFYSLARYAFVQALEMGGVTPGQAVLLPTFLCRDLLAPLACLGAIPVWYDVDERLQAVGTPDDWPDAAAVLAVNYFGFPQDLSIFQRYTMRTGALLIEDNAHGFLSKDAAGSWLGTRATYGLFSIRKTLRIPDGAALLVNDAGARARLPSQLTFDGAGLNPAQCFKARLQRVPLFGRALLKASTALARRVRKLRTGSEVPLTNPRSETELPTRPNPWVGLGETLRGLDVDDEVRRRREAYVACADMAAKAAIIPVFPSLPENCVPYGFPFRSDPAGVLVMRRFAAQNGFDFVTWPDLPGAVIDEAPAYYRNVFLVNFLW